VDPHSNRIYVDAGSQNVLAVISGHTDKVVATISDVPAPGSYQALAVDPATNVIYDAGGGGVTVINGQTNTVTTSITTGTGRGYGAAVDPRTDTVYNTNDNFGSFQATIAAINGNTNKVINEIKNATIAAFDVAADPRTGLAYVGIDQDTVMVVGPCS
jgi:DNA-binding beta-propeller fold protein YncE